MTHSSCRRLMLAVLAAGVVALPRRGAADAPHPVIPGFERFYTGGDADAVQGGRLLLGELNCVSCHQSADKSLTRKQAPVLDHVAARVRVSYLKKFLADPQAASPARPCRTCSPTIRSAGPKVEALVHFLASTGSLQAGAARRQGGGAGRDLYHKVGCVACHGSRDAAGKAEKVLPTSVPLGDLKAKYSIAEPGRLPRKSTRRPTLRPDAAAAQRQGGEGRRQLSAPGNQGEAAAGRGIDEVFLLTRALGSRLPDFAKLKPKEPGTGAAFDLGRGPARRQLRLQVRRLLQDRPGRRVHLHALQRRRLAALDRRQTGRGQRRRSSADVETGQGEADQGRPQGHGRLLPGRRRGRAGACRSRRPDSARTTSAAWSPPRKPASVRSRRSRSIAMTRMPSRSSRPSSKKARHCSPPPAAPAATSLTPAQGPVASTLTATPLDKLKGKGGCLAADAGQGDALVRA